MTLGIVRTANDVDTDQGLIMKDVYSVKKLTLNGLYLTLTGARSSPFTDNADQQRLSFMDKMCYSLHFRWEPLQVNWD